MKTAYTLRDQNGESQTIVVCQDHQKEMPTVEATQQWGLVKVDNTLAKLNSQLEAVAKFG